MLRQVQSLLMALQAVQLVCLATSTLLPMELYEIAHSHEGAHSDAISLHDLLVDTKASFQERTHPLAQVTSTTDGPVPGFLLAHETPQPSRRHRKSASSGGISRRRSKSQFRQGRQMMSHESNSRGGAAAAALSSEPKIYYAVGTSSESDLPICAPNAVCSKIDVYEIPYIERQCICPQQAPLIYHYDHNNMDSRSVSLQKHLENVQRNRPQRILDLNYNVRVPAEEAYIKELIRKLRTAYEIPEIILEDSPQLDTHGGRLLRKRPKFTSNQDMDNVITDKVFSGSSNPAKKRHNHRTDTPKIGGCSALVGRGDGHTIVDKTRQYKVCEPVNRLPECENFGYTWSVRTDVQTNVTQQIVHCRCKKNSVTYLSKRDQLPNGRGFEFLFACAPQNEIRCQRKEPCKLFSVRKRDEVEEVNTHPLCKCPREHSCPKHHTEGGVIGSKNYQKDNVMTYTAYCLADNMDS